MNFFHFSPLLVCGGDGLLGGVFRWSSDPSQFGQQGDHEEGSLFQTWICGHRKLRDCPGKSIRTSTRREFQLLQQFVYTEANFGL